MSLFISYCHYMILSAGFSMDDRDSGGVMANEFIVYQFISRHDSLGGLLE